MPVNARDERNCDGTSALERLTPVTRAARRERTCALLWKEIKTFKPHGKYLRLEILLSEYPSTCIRHKLEKRREIEIEADTQTIRDPLTHRAWIEVSFVRLQWVHAESRDKWQPLFLLMRTKRDAANARVFPIVSRMHVQCHFFFQVVKARHFKIWTIVNVARYAARRNSAAWHFECEMSGRGLCAFPNNTDNASLAFIVASITLKCYVHRQSLRTELRSSCNVLQKYSVKILHDGRCVEKEIK